VSPRAGQDPHALPEARTSCLRPVHILLLGVMLVVPVLVGDLYVMHGDKIKQQTVYTAWLSSTHPYMKTWTYGTTAQRESLSKWRVINFRVQQTIWPLMGIVLVTGLCILPFQVRGFETLSAGNFWIGCSLLLAPFLAMLTFFNLYYVHSYYFIASAPLLALGA